MLIKQCSIETLIVMDSEALKRLEAAGWQSGTVTELLGLTPKEAELIEVRLSLSNYKDIALKKRDHFSYKKQLKTKKSDIL